MANKFEEWIDQYAKQLGPIRGAWVMGDMHAAWHARDAEIAALTAARLALIEHFEKRIESEVSERAEQARRLHAATEKSECGHPKMFIHEHTNACYGKVPETEGTGNYLRCRFVAGYCTLCAEVQAAYARGLRDAADVVQTYFNSSSIDSGRIPLAVAKKAILALKDRRAKGDGE